MKPRYIYRISLLFAFLIILGGCNNDTIDLRDPDVKVFVKQLKAGTYATKNERGIVEVPLFTAKHIPQLLNYCEDMTEIPSFPLLSTPSQYGGKPRLGECVLWLVEYIRLGYYPSLGCKLVRRDAVDYEGIYFLSNEEVLEAATLYRYWWDTVQHPITFPAALAWEFDPLANSNYRWW